MSGGYYYLVFAVVFLGCSSKEQKKGEELHDVVSELPAGNPVEGKALYATCTACHGDVAQGNQHFNAPALANSDSWYLYRQLTNFHKGIRGYLATDTVGL